MLKFDPDISLELEWFATEHYSLDKMLNSYALVRWYNEKKILKTAVRQDCQCVSFVSCSLSRTDIAVSMSNAVNHTQSPDLPLEGYIQCAPQLQYNICAWP